MRFHLETEKSEISMYGFALVPIFGNRIQWGKFETEYSLSDLHSGWFFVAQCPSGSQRYYLDSAFQWNGYERLGRENHGTAFEQGFPQYRAHSRLPQRHGKL